MPYQGYFLLAEDLLEEILYIKLAGAAEAVVAGTRKLTTPDEFLRQVRHYMKTYACRHAFLIDPSSGEICRMG
jgi:hypothetical protein